MAEKTIGRYEIQGELGRGAMGLVYKAYDPVLERHAAIKVMTTSGEMDDELRVRFFREARSAARLSNPHIIAIYDMGDDQNRPFIAMEFVEGEDLKALIRERVFVPFARKLELVGQICRALHYAHRHGVIHRDVKPGNVRLTTEGQVKILDFGLARLGASDMTRTGTLMGTPYYMSPEQAKGAREIDGRSDLFSVGVILYEFLCYRRPFEADSPTAVCYQIIAEPHSPLSAHLPGCDKELEAILDKALAKDPAERFASGEEMASALSAFIAQLPEKEKELRAKVEEIEAEVERRRAEAQQHPLPSLLDPALLDDTLFPQANETAARPETPGGDHVQEDYGHLLQRKAQLEKVLHSMVRDLKKVKPLVESFEHCKHQLQAGQWDDCLANVREMLKLFPRNPDLLAMEKRCLEELERKQRDRERRAQAEGVLQEARQALAAGSYEAAGQKTEEALALQPGWAGALQLREQCAELARREQARALLAEAQSCCRRGGFGESRNLVDKGLELVPNDADLKRLREKLDTLESLIRQASSSLERGDYEEALEIAGHALEVDAEQSAANEIRRTATELLQRRRQIRQMRAEAEGLLSEGRYEACAEICRAGLKLGGVSGVFRRLERQAQTQLQKRKQAEELLAGARQYLLARDYEQAIKQSKAALELVPENAEALQTAQQAEEGVRTQKRLKELIGTARELARNQRWRECLDAVNDGFRIEPGNQELIDLQRQASQALERRRQAAKLSSDAAGFLKQGDYQAALKASEQALALDPQCEEAVKAAAQARSELERRSKIEALSVQARAAVEKQDYEAVRALALEGVALAGSHEELEQLLATANEKLALERQIAGLLEEGRADFDRGRFPEVLGITQEVLRLSPRHPGALELEQKAYAAIREAERRAKVESLRAAAGKAQQAGDADACLKAAAEGLAQDPRDAELQKLRSWAEGRLQEQRAQKERRERADKLLATARKDLSGRRLRRARRRFNELLRLEPGHAEALAAKAQIETALAAQNHTRTRLASFASAALLLVLGLVWLLRYPDVAGVLSDTPAAPPVVRKAPTSPVPPPSAATPPPAEVKAPPPPVEALGQKLGAAQSSLQAKDYATADRLAAEVLALSGKDAKALEIQRQARKHLGEIARYKGRVRSLLSAGKYPEAQAVLVSLRQRAKPDREIQELSEQLQTRTRRAADSARAGLQQSRQRAEKSAAEAGVSLAAAQRLDAEANRLYQSGDYNGSAERSYQARDAYLELDKKAAEILQGRQVESQRQSALSAKRSFDQLRTTAEQLNAETLASGLFSRARAAGSSADQKLQQNDFDSAQKAYQDAGSLMEQALEAARRADDATAGQQQQLQLVRESQRRMAAARQDFAGEDALATAEEAKAQQYVKEGRLAEASAAFENAARRYHSSKSASAALDRIIAGYAAAFSGKDLKTLRNLWPGMDQSNLESFRATFEINESISLSFTPVRFSFDNQQATVVCRAELSLTPKGEKRRVSRSSDSATFKMARAGNSWAIQSFTGNFRSK
ncbi:MAG: protein kinase [Acidobacteriota bacterium]